MACRTVKPPGICGGSIESLFLLPLSRTGSRRRGKKGREQAEQEYLEWALSTFSGYIAADELYDGPFCILSIVDNRTFKRLVYEVLDHNPSHVDIERFFSRFQAALAARGLVLQGVTTDGSPLYPEPIRKVFGAVTHQVCEFHVLADITKAILHGVAKVRKRLKQALPKLPRGRPAGKRAKQLARRNKRLQQRVAELFEHRYLFVQRKLTEAERKILRRITRGLRHLRALRQVMQEVYRLFDRRCRTQTALDKLRKLQYRVKCFRNLGQTLQTLFSPNLAKALTFLDDSLLPATSNAVERGNRRHRKMQKSVYRVRTHHAMVCRMALDLLRDRQRAERCHTLATLHYARAG
jgi:hypothetical protein